jgi:hypothetical protein
MKSPNYFIIKPYGGDRYRTEEEGLIINASIESHEHTNRLGEVMVLPNGYNGVIEVGDLIAVHHNTFRLMRTQTDKLVSSAKSINDELFYTLDPYMVIKGDKKIAIDPYMFLKRVNFDDEFIGSYQHENIGVIAVTSEYQEKELNLKKGMIVSYKDYSNYYFNILGEEYIRIKLTDVLAEV